MAENEQTAQAFDVFLSFNSQDREIVRRVGRLLKQHGLRVWMDEWELVPGRLFQEDLESALQTTNSAAVFVGPSGFGPWHRPEMRICLSQFVKRNLPVIPVLLPSAPDSPELPPFLEELTWVDFRGGLTGPNLNRLIWGITGKKPQNTLTPNYISPLVKDIGEKLNSARLRKADLTAAGSDLSEVNSEILNLKRKLRDGATLKAGDFLGKERFRLLDMIGSGGFATVWKAYDFTRDELVALKVLHGQYAQGKQKKQRFFRGARQMAKLRHPNIVSVIESEGEGEGFYYLVMEFVAGMDLHRRVRTLGSLTVEEVVRIVCAVGAGISYAHKEKVIHRDVKPSNILVSDDGTVKLTDFDLVKAEETTGGTRTGAMGSFVFAAPELMMQAKTAKQEVDVYGLAMTTVFGLYGRDLPPVIFRDPSRFIKGLKIPKATKGVLIKGTAWEVTDRYPTVGAFCEALAVSIEDSEWKSSIPKPDPPKKPLRPQLQKIQSKLDKIPTPEDRDYWVWLEPGTFLMGNGQSSRDSQELAQPVTITYGFWIGRVPVTNAVFREFMETGGYLHSKWWDTKENRSEKEPEYLRSENYGNWDQPVVGVSWYEARAYCRWLTHYLEQAKLDWWEEGMQVVLPTEVQWEYAARGPEGREYPWGTEYPDKTRANFGRKVGTTTAVGSYPAGSTPQAILDLAGNVWEWCQDPWDEKASQERKPDVKDPIVDKFSTACVVRGGSWYDGAGILRATYRDWNLAGNRFDLLGFRCVLMAKSADHFNTRQNQD